MRPRYQFLALFLGAFTALTLGVSGVSAKWFAPDPTASKEYRQLAAEKWLADFKATRLEEKNLLLEVELDKYRRSTRDPVHPKGVVIPAEDRIPAPSVPFPTTPADPNK